MCARSAGAELVRVADVGPANWLALDSFNAFAEGASETSLLRIAGNEALARALGDEASGWRCRDVMVSALASAGRLPEALGVAEDLMRHYKDTGQSASRLQILGQTITARFARGDFTAALDDLTDALVGYLKRFGPLTAKAFVGVSAIEHDISPFDPQNPVEGLDYGPKVVAEFWLNMGPSYWSSLDLNWTSAHDTYSGRVRTGYRVLEHVSLGAEARIDGNALDQDTRGGLFARYDWAGGEVSLAGGVSGRMLENASDMTDPYATLTWLTQY